MSELTVGFIGGGNMARSLIGGLRKTHAEVPSMVFDPSAESLAALQADFNIQPATSNQQLLEHADVVVLAVKPQAMQSILSQLDVSQYQGVVLSIAAGIRSQTLCKWLKQDIPLIRAMPNTPALVNCGATGLYANAQVTDTQKQHAELIMHAVGLAVWVENEDLIDAVTAVSGSGPAYFFLVMEAMQLAAEQLGLDSKTARTLTLQTALGAATLANQSDKSPAALRQHVTSPGGTTEQAINSFLDDDFISIFGKAIQAAYDRSQTLAKQLDNN